MSLPIKKNRNSLFVLDAFEHAKIISFLFFSLRPCVAAKENVRSSRIQKFTYLSSAFCMSSIANFLQRICESGESRAIGLLSAALASPWILQDFEV